MGTRRGNRPVSIAAGSGLLTPDMGLPGVPGRSAKPRARDPPHLRLTDAA
jgi:hypothetical protein